MTRLESLLLITSPGKESDGSPEISVPAHLSHAEDGADDRYVASIGLCTVKLTRSRSRGNTAKHLGRVAAEYTQLLYHASKARTERCIFVDEIQWVCEVFHINILTL